MPGSKPFDPSYHANSVRRVQSIAKQMSPPATTSFPAEVVPQAPEDALFGLMRAYRADESPDKVDLVSRTPGAGGWPTAVVTTNPRCLSGCSSGPC